MYYLYACFTCQICHSVFKNLSVRIVLWKCNTHTEIQIFKHHLHEVTWINILTYTNTFDSKFTFSYPLCFGLFLSQEPTFELSLASWFWRFYFQTNIPFLENVLKHEQFVTGKVDTSFIDENPDLTQKLVPGQNRAQKLLYYFANLMVNGPSTPLATGLMPANVKPSVPPQRGILGCHVQVLSLFYWGSVWGGGGVGRDTCYDILLFTSFHHGSLRQLLVNFCFVNPNFFFFSQGIDKDRMQFALFYSVLI